MFLFTSSRVPQKFSPVRVFPKKISPVRVFPKEFSPVRVFPKKISPVRVFPKKFSPVCVFPKKFSPVRVFPNKFSPLRVLPQQISPVGGFPTKELTRSHVTYVLTRWCVPFYRIACSPPRFPQYHLCPQHRTSTYVRETAVCSPLCSLALTHSESLGLNPRIRRPTIPR